MTKSTQKSREVRLVARNLKKIALELHQTKQNYMSAKKNERMRLAALEKIRTDDAAILKNTIRNLSEPLYNLRRENKELKKEVARLRRIQHNNLLTLRHAAQKAMEYRKTVKAMEYRKTALEGEEYTISGGYVFRGSTDI